MSTLQTGRTDWDAPMDSSQRTKHSGRTAHHSGLVEPSTNFTQQTAGLRFPRRLRADDRERAPMHLWDEIRLVHFFARSPQAQQSGSRSSSSSLIRISVCLFCVIGTRDRQAERESRTRTEMAKSSVVNFANVWDPPASV